MEDNLQILKKKGYTFYWNDADSHWWLTKFGKNGKLVRTEPIKAENRADAENAAVDQYIRGRSSL
jgi:hypothetical protein